MTPEAKRAAKIARVQKLLRLTASPNANEAARATQRAAELMAAHGLSYDDVAVDDEPDVTEVVDDSSDFFREQIALAVAQSRGCRLRGRHHHLAVVGRAAAARDAAALYHTLVAVGASGQLGIDNHESARRIYHRLFWTSFTHAVVARIAALGVAPPPHAAPSPAPPAAASGPQGVTVPRQARRDPEITRESAAQKLNEVTAAQVVDVRELVGSTRGHGGLGCGVGLHDTRDVLVVLEEQARREGTAAAMRVEIRRWEPPRRGPPPGGLVGRAQATH